MSLQICNCLYGGHLQSAQVPTSFDYPIILCSRRRSLVQAVLFRRQAVPHMTYFLYARLLHRQSRNLYKNHAVHLSALL